MRKTILFRAALFALALMLLLGGASGAVFADGSADGSADVVWSVSAKDAEGHDLTLVSAEDVENSLGKGFALDCGKDAQGTPITEPKVDDLRRGGMKITPPAGYAVSSVFLVADGASRAEGSRSLLLLAQASADGSGAVTLPAAIFAEGYDASAVGTVFNGSGSRYVLQIALDRIASDAQVTVNYTAGSLADVLGDTALVAGGNTAVFPIDADRHSASFSVAALDAAVADSALRTLGKQFTGWKMSLSNGARAAFSGGESVSLSSSATFEAQWKDVIVFAFTGGEKLYDGTPLTASYTRSGDVKGGDVLEVPDDAFALSRTEPGETEATLDLSRVRVTRDGADVTGEYEFTVIPATLRVVQRGVSFTVSDAQKEYDGTPLVPSNYSFDQSVLVEGHTVSAAFSGQQTVPGSSTGSAVFTISDADGRDVTGCYNVSVINGMLTVTARSEKQPITVTIKEAEKEYDGQPLNEAGYSVTDGSLLGSDTLSVQSFSGGITEVGTGSLSAAFSVLNGGTDVSDNYSINVVPGKMTVRPRAIVLTADSAEKEYDGTALTKDSFSLSSGSLVSGHSVSAKVSGSQTAAGSSANKIVADSVSIIDGNGNDFTAMYKISTVDGTLTVKAAAKTPITITMKSAEKEYDGKALSSKDYEITSGKLADGDELTIDKIKGEQTDVGESSVTASFAVKRGGSDVTENYEITVVPGKLTVKPRAIVLTADSAEKDFDGTALTKDSFSLSSGRLVSGHSVSAKVSGSQTAAGSSANKIVADSVKITDGSGRDLTEMYSVRLVDGTLTVKNVSSPTAITITMKSAEKVYDGKALSSKDYEISSDKLAEGDELTIGEVMGEQLDVGESSVTASFTVKRGNSDVTAKYTITIVAGKLTVKARPVAVTMKDAQKEYDGNVLSSKAYEISSGTIAEGDTLTIGEVKGEQLGVGESSVTASFTVKRGENDVTGNYTLTVVPGRLTVKPRSIVLTADSAEKDYDGKALTKDSFSVTSGSLVSGHSISATVSGSQTAAGSSANKIDAASVKITDGSGKILTGMYSIRLVDGTLTVKGINQTAITITMKSAEKVYDGKVLTSKDYEITSGKLADGDTLTVGEIKGEQLGAGESSVTASFTVKHGANDVTASYAITVVPGKLTVKPRPITITADSASKVYDGRALTRDSWKLTTGELVKGHKLTASVSGSQTDLGSSANVVVKNSIKIVDSEKKDVTANYEITTAAGTLTVNRDPITAITLTVGDGSKVYDGKPYRFIAADIRVTSGTLPAGYTIDATFNPEAPTDVGKYEVTIKSVTIRNASGADVTSQFNITRARGTLTITERPLVISTKAANKVYDGTPLTERSTPSISGRVEGHQVTLRITGSQTKVGSSENTVSDVKITDKETGADVTKNYAISYQYGLLTVTEADGGDTAADPYTWVSGSTGTLFIKFDHDYEGFEGLQIDGKDVDRSNYTSASGSTEIWLKASFLNTLSSGSHKLTAKYAGGEKAETSFAIKGTQGTRTGDNSRLGLWIFIMAAALLASFAAAWYLFLGKDRRWKTKPITFRKRK